MYLLLVKNRSKTFQCVAEAFATQWGDYIKETYHENERF